MRPFKSKLDKSNNPALEVKAILLSTFCIYFFSSDRHTHMNDNNSYGLAACI